MEGCVRTLGLLWKRSAILAPFLPLKQTIKKEDYEKDSYNHWQLLPTAWVLNASGDATVATHALQKRQSSPTRVHRPVPDTTRRWLRSNGKAGNQGKQNDECGSK